MTPYGAAKLINTQLSADGFDKVLPAQMFYNYTSALLKKNKRPMIPSTLNEDGSVEITTEDLATWYQKYTTKLSTKVS
jgi:hypothetical protein